MELFDDDLEIGRRFAAYAKKSLSGLQGNYAEKEAKRCDMYRRLWEKKNRETTGKNAVHIGEEQGFVEVEINDLFNSLTEIQRKIVELIIIKQFPEEHVAGIMNITQQRVNKIKQSAIEILRKELSEQS